MEEIDTSEVDIFVFTEREGALGAVGHDLKLSAERFSIRTDGREVAVEVDSNSLRVTGCIVDGAEKSVKLVDRKVIERNLAKDVLVTKKHPKITFRGTVTDASQDGFRLSGTLTLRGESRPLDIAFRRDVELWVGESTIDQPQWGITPYSTFLGALRIKREVRLQVVLPSTSFTP